jgi:hypothetical protein
LAVFGDSFAAYLVIALGSVPRKVDNRLSPAPDAGRRGDIVGPLPVAQTVAACLGAASAQSKRT